MDTAELQKLLESAQEIVVMQADNPDGDSLGSALALEQIFGDMGKEVSLYCGVDIPEHLRYLPGWDRVTKDLPNKFDLTVIVDAGSEGLLESLQKTNQRSFVAAKPVVVLDHHGESTAIPYATITINEPVVATGELIYELAQKLNWPLNQISREMLAISILSDSLGLSTDATSARSIHIIAELVEQGVHLADIDNRRRLLMRKEPELVRYKGELLQRIEYHADNRIAIVIIPWPEIERYSHAYNPPMLVIDDMRMTTGTDIAIAFKSYPDGKVTAKIRSNFGKPIASDLAAHFGGGGHPYASGFKVTDGRLLEDIKNESIKIATELLDKLAGEIPNEAI